MRNHEFQDLLKALKLNVVEYGNKKSKVKQSQGLESKTYIGRRAILRYKEDVLDNLSDKQDAVPDILLIDQIRRFELPYLFLDDLLGDILYFDSSVGRIKKKLEDLLEKFEYIYKKVGEELFEKKINYEYIDTILPKKEYYGLKVSKNNMNRLLKFVEILIRESDEIYLNLADENLYKTISK